MKVEFVGLFSPYVHPDIQRTLAQRPTSPEARKHLAAVRKELTRQERARQMGGWARVQGHTQRTIGPESGLSRAYTWGPHVWVVEMEPRDVEALMRLHDLHRQAFRVIPDVIELRSA